jgi:hypothetical protein
VGLERGPLSLVSKTEELLERKSSGTVLSAVAADFFFSCWCLEVPSDNQGASTIMRKALDWKRSRISMSEVEAVPQSCIP